MTEQTEEMKTPQEDTPAENGDIPVTPKPPTADEIIEIARAQQAEKNRLADEENRLTYHASWWWGVIPAVAAIVILIFWITGQSEEVFGIDPRGIWVGETIVKIPAENDQPGHMTRKQAIRWELLLEDVAGELWVKITRDRKVVLAGPATIEENAVSHKSTMGYFHGIYHTKAVRFRYNPFVRRYIDAVFYFANGEAYDVRLERI